MYLNKLSSYFRIWNYTKDRSLAKKAIRLANKVEHNENLQLVMIMQTRQLLNSAWKKQLTMMQEHDYVYLRQQYHLNDQAVLKMNQISIPYLRGQNEMVTNKSIKGFGNFKNAWTSKNIVNNYVKLAQQQPDKFADLIDYNPYFVLHLNDLVNDDVFYLLFEDQIKNTRICNKQNVVNINDYR